MAYDEKLAIRIRKALSGLKKVEEKKMMGGLTFMVNGKMCIGIIKDELMCRIDPAIYNDCLQKKGCHIMAFTGKPLKGFVLVNNEGMKAKKDFDFWITISLEFNKKSKAYKRPKSKAS